MNMKFKFLAAITMAMGLFSCSNDEGLDNTTPGGQGILGNAETYATIRIAMPGGADAMGRALTKTTDPENGNGTEQGSENENNFYDITLYIFDGHNANSTCKGVLTIGKDKFDKQQDEEKNIVYQTSRPIKVGIEGSEMKVYAVMNGSVSGANAGINLETFLEKTVKTDVVFNENKDKFLMTSRTPGELSIIEENNKENNPAKLEVSVERTAAKITYKAENTTQGQENQYEVKKEGTSDVAATVTLTDYKLVNLRNDAYFFRKVAGSDGKWKEAADFGNGKQTGSNFVIDPYFTEKTVAAAKGENFVTEWFGPDQEYAENTNIYSTLPKNGSHTTLGYCMENTTTQDAQLNGYSTGIIFQATYAPKEVYVLNQEKNNFEATSYTNGETFYSYANVLYKSKQDIAKFYGIDENSELIKKYNGDGSKGATCYYKYWIRHMNNNNNEDMGIMEFAIVRNNVYKLSVSKVNDLGDPTGEIDPNNPDETSKFYLEVKVSILPWVVRNNEGIEL